VEFQGDFADAMYWTKPLSSSEVSDVWQYASIKYNIQ